MAKIYYLPEPYPDELIGSILVRAGRHLGQPIKRMHHLFGLIPKSHWPLFFQNQIPLIASAMAMPASELLFKHTPFPYVTAFISAEQTLRLAKYYCQSQRQNSSALSQSASTGGISARYCDACIAEDIGEVGEDYWHRSHNLPFVTRCWKHGLRLKAPERKGAGLSITGLPHEQHGVAVRSLFDEHIHSLVEPASIALLESTLRQPTKEWQRHYRQIAEQRGFPRQGRLLSSMAIIKGVITYFGDNQLIHAGVEVSDKRSPWPAMLLRLNETSNIAAKHILMQIYLQNASAPEPVTTSEPGPQPLNCQRMDPVFASAIRKHLSKLAIGTRITVTQLLSQLDILQPVRHHRKKLPLTSAAIEAFRHTQFSERQTGRRPRKKHKDL